MINPLMAKFRVVRRVRRHVEIRAVRGNFLRVASVVWRMTISSRGDPSQKHGPLFGLVLSETPFDPPPALSTQLLVSTLP